MTMLDKYLRSPVIVLAALLTFALPASAPAGGDWNDAAIKWRGYEAGLTEAKESGKPVCLVLYTDWCPHCSNYSGVFHDKEVVEVAKKFVTIRLNKDEHPAISAKYAPDGEYIPRTFFLSPAGDLDANIHEQREKYLYFYNEAAPAGLLRGMTEALKKHGGASAS